ncbi:MAG: hypothetical protein CM15mP129_05990 [Chloroflexota bacterium]|nr:MAG: hypothetical protein CM15mP129_05990 [Chloroflexota bacterium]
MQKYKIKICGNVRTWDHLTKNGPVINGLDEYWVWNPIMKKELINFQKLMKIKSMKLDLHSLTII